MTCPRAFGPALSACLFALAALPVAVAADGIRPTGADGRPLNLDFESGSLRDWKATGAAFEKQPVKGDTVAPRRPGVKSAHQGRYWVGGYEILGDDATGTLTSVPFKVTHRWASFLANGGPWPKTCVELVSAGDNKVFFHISGTESETLRPVVVDLEKHLNKRIYVRLVDQQKGQWGHINFDNFLFHEAKPQFKDELVPPPPPPPEDAYKFAGLPGQQAAKVMTLPEGFRATLFAGEPDIINPIAFTIDPRGRLWVVQGLTYPHRAPDGQGKDTILIFEDTDGDGKHDKRTVFADKLNLVSGIEVGFGGVWLGAAPYLLFIPDKDGDDRPDSEPQILLDGWGYQDTHETLNTFCWGPDGWLYGCHGVFTYSSVGKPGTPKAQRQNINAGIWRYHPTKHVFERFAEGTSNPWGLDFDANGQMITEACVIPHLWHIIQGGRYQRQAGNHDNPYTFDDIKQIGDHVHYAGTRGPHAGNNRSDAAGGGHAHAGLMVYLGGTWPEEYHGKIFMNNIHGARINMDIPEPKGSGFVGRHGKDFCLFNDRASQVINLRYGPDGNVYLIDWYDLNQCHHGRAEGHDRTTGRIYKISYGDAKATPVDLSKLTDRELVDLNWNDNDWHARTARRLLQERAATGKLALLTRAALAEQFSVPSANESRKLRSLWGMHVTGGSGEKFLLNLLRNPPTLDVPGDPAVPGSPSHSRVQVWPVAGAIQLLCEDGKLSAAALKEFAELARSGSSPVVRLYLASAVLRLPAEQRWEILAGLLAHSEDGQDHNLPLMYWYGLESVVGADPARAMAMALESKVPNVLSFTVRRIGAAGDDASLATLAGSLEKVQDDSKRVEILKGINAALKGRRTVPMPKGWETVEEQLAGSTNAGVRAQAQALSATFGSPRALVAMKKKLSDAAAPPEERLAALDSLLGAKEQGLAPVLQQLLKDDKLRGPALKGLAAYDDPKTPAAILESYAALSPAEKKDALLTLTSRVNFARELLNAVGTTVPPGDFTADVLRQLRTLNNPNVESLLTKNWGVVRETEQDKLDKIAKVKGLLNAKNPGFTMADPANGRVLYNKICGQCHVLFDSGGKVGPDITGSNRQDIDYLLLHVIDPNAVIPNDYRASQLDTKDDRTILGIVKKEDAQAVTIVTANESLVIPRGEVATLKPSPLSMMPDGLLDTMTPQEVRDLVAYLRSPEQVPLPKGAGGTGGANESGAGLVPATPENAKTLFNGKDLTGWDTRGVEGLWSVQNGEVVGKTEKGLKQNEFLSSRLVVSDFRLTLKVKLVPNTENSGIQIRSERLTGQQAHEMRGCQVDMGQGWWGKLYEESGRGLLWPPKGQQRSYDQFVNKGDWNTYEILAVGNKVRTALNGNLCVDLEDDKIAKSGVIALQVHSGGPTEVRFKDLELEVNPRWEMKTVKQ
jgi:putative membrane-bound dehydrogenase-like protein